MLIFNLTTVTGSLKCYKIHWFYFMAQLYKLSVVLLPCWKGIGASGKDIFLEGGSEAVSYMRELQFCLSSVCFLVLLKKKSYWYFKCGTWIVI